MQLECVFIKREHLSDKADNLTVCIVDQNLTNNLKYRVFKTLKWHQTFTN